MGLKIISVFAELGMHSIAHTFFRLVKRGFLYVHRDVAYTNVVQHVNMTKFREMKNCSDSS